MTTLMTDFIIKRLPYNLNSNAGLALVGKYLKRINIKALVNPVCPFVVALPTATSSNATLGCCVWARTTLMLLKRFAVMGLRGAPWVLERRLRA